MILNCAVVTNFDSLMQKYYALLFTVLLALTGLNRLSAQVPQFFYTDTICHNIATAIGIPPAPDLFYTWTPNFGIVNPNASTTLIILPNTSPEPYEVEYTLNAVDLFLNLIEQHHFTITVSPIIFTSQPLIEASICLGDTITIPFLNEWPLNAEVIPNVECQVFPGDSIKFFPSSTRDYIIQFADSANCIIRQRTVTIDVFEIPDPSITASITSFCVFDSLTVPLFLAPDGGNLVGAGVDTSGFFRPHVAGIGTHVIYYRFDNPGCAVADSIVMNVFGNPEINMNLLPAVCANAQPFIPDVASPVGGFYMVNGEFIIDLNPVQYNLGVNTLSYTLIIGDNCISTDSILFNIVPPPAKPTIDVKPEGLVCEGGNFILTSSFFSNYEWSTGDTTQVITVSQNGDYYVEIISNLGCRRSSDTVSVNFIPQFTGALESPLYPNGFNVSGYQAQDGSIELILQGGVPPFDIIWSEGSVNTQNLNNLAEGDYFVFVTDAAGCSDSLFITLTGPAEPAPDTTSNVTVTVPNGFTPNGDGLNDLFVIKNLEQFPDNTIEVYNRFGNIVFRQSPYSNDWNGIGNRGKLLPSGTYYFILNLKDSESISGFIDLRY